MRYYCVGVISNLLYHKNDYRYKILHVNNLLDDTHYRYIHVPFQIATNVTQCRHATISQYLWYILLCTIDTSSACGIIVVIFMLQSLSLANNLMS